MWIASVREINLMCISFQQQNKIRTGCHYFCMLVAYFFTFIRIFIIILPYGDFKPNSHFFNWNYLPSKAQIVITVNIFFP